MINTMSLTRGAVKYTCTCGAGYLIAFEPESSEDDWLVVVREAAEQLGFEAVDGANPMFVCSNCGRMHERSDTVVFVGRE
jgi:hypothetical protein